MECVYRGQSNGRLHGELPIYDCQLHEQCVLADGDASIAACDQCDKRLAVTDQDFNGRWVDPLVIYDRTRKPTHALRGMLAGRSVFLACGGPSANDHALEHLSARGCWTMAVNNMAAHHRFRPQAFVCTDPPEKFADSIWLDPQIMKFISHTKMGNRNQSRIRHKTASGEFVRLSVNGKPLHASECPNAWGVKRRQWVAIDDSFFLDDSAPCGNFDAGTIRTGEPKTVCTMLFAMRLLRYLGARRVFLIGVDLIMDTERGSTGNYAFPEARDEGACESNNAQYAITNDWLCRLEQQGVFGRFGIEFYNCNPRSGLRAFPHVPFNEAFADVTSGVSNVDLTGWYAK